MFVKAVHDQQLSAGKHLQCKLGTEPSNVMDVSVTSDGTWTKQGFTAQHGVVLVISGETGEVLECEVLSMYCDECTIWDIPEIRDSERYRQLAG